MEYLDINLRSLIEIAKAFNISEYIDDESRKQHFWNKIQQRINELKEFFNTNDLSTYSYSNDCSVDELYSDNKKRCVRCADISYDTLLKFAKTLNLDTQFLWDIKSTQEQRTELCKEIEKKSAELRNKIKETEKKIC